MTTVSTINQHMVKFNLTQMALQDYQDPNDTTLKVGYEPRVDFSNKTIELRFAIPSDVQKAVANILQGVDLSEEYVEWLCRVATVPYGSTIVKCGPAPASGGAGEYVGVYNFSGIPEKARQHGVQVRLYARIKNGKKLQGKVVSSSSKSVNISLERQGNGVLSIKSINLGGPLWRLNMYADDGIAFAPCIEIEKDLGDATTFLVGGIADVILPAVVRDVARYLMRPDEDRDENDADMVRAWKIILDLQEDMSGRGQGEIDEHDLNEVVDTWVKNKYLGAVSNSKSTLAERYQSMRDRAVDPE